MAQAKQIVNSNKRIPKIIILLLPVLLFVIYAVCLYKPDLPIMPVNGRYLVYPYNDSTDTDYKGNTESVVITQEAAHLEYRFTLNRVARFPYAGCSIKPKDKKYLNVKGYDRILLDISGINLDFISLYLVVYIDHFTEESDYFKYCYFQKDFPVKNNRETIVLDFQEFQIPIWWINKNKISNPEFFKNKIIQLDHVNIESGPLAKIGIESGYIVREITFKQDYIKRLAVSLLYLVLTYLCIFMLFFFIGKMKKGLIIVPYEKINLGNKADDEQDRIILYIAAHFSEPDMSLEKASRELGMHPVKIGALIKKHFHANFKQYLNKIRISEVKRLLVESDRQITEIAVETGFNSIAHFNRVFKQQEAITPKEYRRKARPPSR